MNEIELKKKKLIAKAMTSYNHKCGRPSAPKFRVDSPITVLVYDFIEQYVALLIEGKTS